MTKKIETVTVPAHETEVWSDEEGCFVQNTPSNFYIVNGLGDSVYFLTKDRAKAQAVVNELYGDNKYVIRAVKDQKGRSKLESGEYSVVGSNTRKCFSPRLKGLK